MEQILSIMGSSKYFMKNIRNESENSSVKDKFEVLFFDDIHRITVFGPLPKIIISPKIKMVEKLPIICNTLRH